MRSFVIDGGSCINVVFEEACKKLGLKVEPHPSTFEVVWVNNTNLQIQEICLVTYSLGGFTDQVMCDVLLLKVLHIYLGIHDFMTRRRNTVVSRTPIPSSRAKRRSP